MWFYCRSRRQQDQLLREAQDQAFRESLEADREKERKKREGEKREEEERERQREREREERQREEVGPASYPAHVPSAAVVYFPPLNPLTPQELAVKRAICVSRLPPEPEVGDPQAIHVMLRTPGGERLERRFSASDKLQVSNAKNCDD